MGILDDDPARDPLESMARGATKGALDWPVEKIAELVRKLRNKKLAFIEDQPTIDLVKRERGGGEFSIYEPYLGSWETRVPVQMGLVLRRKADDQEAVADLREKIRRKFGESGLHLAQATQAEILPMLMQNVAKAAPTRAAAQQNVARAFEEVDQYVYFVQEGRNSNFEASAITAKFRFQRPAVFVVAGSGHASDDAAEVARLLSQANPEYAMERVVGKWRVNYVFIRNR